MVYRISWMDNIMYFSLSRISKYDAEVNMASSFHGYEDIIYPSMRIYVCVYLYTRMHKKTELNWRVRF